MDNNPNNIIENSPVPANQPVKQVPKSKILLYLILFVLLLITAEIFYYFTVKNKPTAIINTVPITVPITPNISPVQKITPLASPISGFTQYSNELFRFGFYYPESDELYKCPDLLCFSIERIGLRVQVLMSYYVSDNPLENLLTVDLYCNAGGPGSSITCKNNKVEAYTNPLGTKGYKVYRTRTRSGKTSDTIDDIAYVYVFPDRKKVDNLYYSGILFATDDPTPANLSEMQSIADKFFIF